MTILVTNNYLKSYGGSETFTFALIEALCKLGHTVEYFTFEKGLTSQKIEDELHVNFLSKTKYDVVFANHKSCVEYLRKKIHPSNIIIQTCHGIYPKLEQPSSLANGHIAISEEVNKHLSNLGFSSQIILNGIDTKRFAEKTPVNQKLKKVLSLCQSEQANSEIEKACNQLNIEFFKLNKFKAPVWNVEDNINNVDLVIGLGRSAYEAMACGRPVIIYDNRPYAKSYADGYVDKKMIDNSIKNNCSGRFYKKSFTSNDLVDEFKKYDMESGNFLRAYASANLNIEIQTKKYLDYFHNHASKRKLLLKNSAYYVLKNFLFFISIPYYFFKLTKWFKRYSKEEPTVSEISKLKKEIILGKLNKKEIIHAIEALESVKKKNRLTYWNSFIETKLTKKHKNQALRIAKNPTITATIVEARKHPHFKTIVQNALSNLEHLEVGLNVYHGTENEAFVKDCLKDYNSIRYINLQVKNLDIEAYNKIMLSKEFHREIPTDKFLVFQTDTITFKPLDKEFLNYDYIGAPWRKENHDRYGAQVGNGGLSLRSKTAILTILEQNIPREENDPEDLYLSRILTQQQFNIAPYEVALQFATEDVYAENTFGCHKSWELIRLEQLKKIINQAL